MSFMCFSKGQLTSFRRVLQNCPVCIEWCMYLQLEKQIIDLYQRSQFLRRLNFCSKLCLSQYIMKAVSLRIKEFLDLRVKTYVFLEVRKTEDSRSCELFKGNLARQSSWEQDLSLLLLSLALLYHASSWTQIMKHKAKLGAYISTLISLNSFLD